MGLKIGFHALTFHTIPAPAIEDLVQLFFGRGFEIYISDSLLKPLDKFIFKDLPIQIFSEDSDLSSLSLILSLGGDGTILDSLLFAVPYEIPILGVHFGRLGFLPNILSSELKNVADILLSGKVPVLRRALLEISIEGGNPFNKHNYALNEVSITKRDSASMITIHTYINQEFLNEYWGDGLIISTPTGSTGYSLSCGGPIVWPESKGMIITPVSPHNLSMRPIVLPDDIILDLIPKGRQQKVMLSMDSRSKPVTINQPIRIKKSIKEAVFLDVPNSSFPRILREKLFWGKDLRN
jgi:NAD+ kinase